MSLLRKRQPVSPIERTAAETRLDALEVELQALPRPIHRSTKALLILCEKARQFVIAGHLDDARRTIGSAVIILDEIDSLKNDANDITVAHASVMLAEALLGIDSPKHAKPRLVRAVEILDRSGDARWRVRARLAFGRLLVCLDDVSGLTVLEECRQICKMLNEKAAIVQIEEELREAEKVFDTPRHIHTGYGRPVSVAPPPNVK